jgi:hypothetical protein
MRSKHTGRFVGWRRKVTDCQRLHASDCQVTEGQLGAYTWVSHTWQGRQTSYRIAASYSLQRVGGRRSRCPWLFCPTCHLRRGVLYLAPDMPCYGCRTCLHLAYPSEANRLSRAEHAQCKLEARIRQEGSRYVKPKWMHWRTFKGLCERLEAARSQVDALTYARLPRRVRSRLETLADVAGKCWPVNYLRALQSAATNSLLQQLVYVAPKRQEIDMKPTAVAQPNRRLLVASPKRPRR